MLGLKLNHVSKRGHWRWRLANYRQTFNIRRNLVGKKIADHLDVVGASPVGAAPTSSSVST